MPEIEIFGKRPEDSEYPAEFSVKVADSSLSTIYNFKLTHEDDRIKLEAHHIVTESEAHLIPDSVHDFQAKYAKKALEKAKDYIEELFSGVSIEVTPSSYRIGNRRVW